MAEQDNQQEQPKKPGSVNIFTGMVKDPLDLFKKDNTYTHARNMTNYLSDGGIGGKSTEPSNVASAGAPYTIIGCIYLSDDQWAIFSTNNTNSEIGLFIDSTNTYSVLMNDAAAIAAGLPGLNFNTSNLITGTARRGFECGFDIYWSDGQRNPDRTVNTAVLPFSVTAKVYPNPWKQNCTVSAGCITCVNTDQVDIEQLRLAPLYSTPCIKLSRHQGSGQLGNGSYQVCVAYAINGIKCTDYIAFSNVYSTFTHLNNGGSIDITISNIDDITKIRFTELEVVIISMVNEQIEAKKLGTYSTNQGVINISLIDKTLPNIPIEKLPVSTPAIVSSDAIFSISNYLTRVGPKERPDFNYQPLANQITGHWVAVEYPEDYYHAGGDNIGMNVGYLRGEVYAFYIRWVYSTGDKSADYPIPGLPGGTAPTISIGGPSTGDTGTTLYSGRFGGYSSTEIYPDRTPTVYGSLCGQPIMHHRFPDQANGFGTSLSHFNPNGKPPLGQKGTISIMGVYFDNIKPPVDNNGNVIRDIVGYEILRAVRDGHESILAKGMVNNMRTYTTFNGGPVDGLFQNYPYNDLSPDYFLTSNISNINNGTTGNGANSPLTGYRNDFLSFHSPDTVFSHPFLGQGQLDLVMALQGVSKGKFTQPYKHPMFKVLSDFDSWLSNIITLTELVIDVITAIQIVTGANPPDITLAATEALPMNLPFFANNDYTLDVLATDLSVATKIAAGIANVAVYIALVPLKLMVYNEQLTTIIKGLIPARQYALQYNSFGYYDTPASTGRITANINDYMYIKGQMQSFAGYTVNNLYRNEYVAIKCGSVPPRQGDTSRYNVGPVTNPELNVWHTDHNGIPNNLDSYYGAYTVSQTAQYGQVDSTKQVPIGCVQQVNVLAASASGGVFSSPVLFGGDTYINRYTEKNPMMFFNDWLVNAPEDFKYDYRNYINVPYPMFWINNDVVNFDLLGQAHKNRRLDGPMNMTLFYVKQGYFYLFNNGIRDFFVESSVNVGYRDWEDEIPKMFYDPYGSSDDFINDYFRSDIIKSSILYKYDYSLSANRFINQYISWGKCLRRDYDPELAYTCFSYYPRRVAYSLPQEEEQISDNWKIFLPNNYKPFNDKVKVIKDLHKTGAIFLMESSSPFMFAGVETIPSKNSTEYTVGTGLLFQQSLQSVGNVDDSYEHASCQSEMGVINTPYGIFWVSQSTGKLFTLREGHASDIGQEAGLKFWLLKYIPSQLLATFPNFPLADNPVAGVGMQLMYDSITEVLYITKKDFVADSIIQFDGTDFYFIGSGGTKVTVSLGDSNFFQDASWTLSYDCKSREFISFHDWHPTYHVPSKNHFLTTPGNTLWRHNDTVQSYCNFYGTDYPAEIEFFTNSQINETILQSVEYLLESYQYAPNGFDKFLNYDEGFDQIMISNREQNSTLQNMVLQPWNDPYSMLNYPQFIGPTRTVLYSKVENKYRVNDFYDYTKDRGQFTLANVPMITTDPNGYTFNTNTTYFDLFKPWNQLKKFRYTGTRIFMRKTHLGKNSLTIRYANTKNQFSPR